MALTSDGNVWAWGFNGNGELGLETPKMQSTPKIVKGIKGNVVKIVSGGYHNLALTDEGEIFSWGSNSCGELGNGNTLPQSKPQKILGLPSRVCDISTGREFTMACLQNGKNKEMSLYGWGKDVFHETNHWENQEKQFLFI